MKRFLAHMNLARWVILVSLVASLALAVVGWRNHARRVALEDALERRVPLVAQNIQKLSRQYTKLYKEAEREGLKGQADPASYIRELAANANVALGQVEILPQQPRGTARGVVDRTYQIRPQSRDKGFTRDRIANFMWLLEQQSRRVRVTRVRLEPEARTRPWEVPPDLWKWEVEVTSRQKDSSAN